MALSRRPPMGVLLLLLCAAFVCCIGVGECWGGSVGNGFGLRAPISAQPIPLNFTRLAGQKVLIIVAHPDDISGYMGATVYLLTQAGCQVEYLIVTNGDKGGQCYNDTARYNCDSAQLGVVRQQEQLQAAQVVGVNASSVTFLDYRDQELRYADGAALRRTIVIHVRRFQPFAVFTHFPYPDFNAVPNEANEPTCWDDMGFHPDHQTLGGVVFDAIRGFAAHLNLLYPELAASGLLGWKVTEFYMFALTRSYITHYVNITGAPINMKMSAFLKHKSQYSAPSDITEFTQWLGTAVAQEVGVEDSDVQQAEAFTGWF